VKVVIGIYPMAIQPIASLARTGRRNTTVKDAREHGLLPSVTTIIACHARPALEIWKQQNAILAALTLPRIDGESEGVG